ncbi:MAG: hypothetical protein P0Y55_01355 [Candidatus Cohnella colombiensis]|uniref:Uncharacterized protein n=1 Tax=Candidatus Cohnella colombiensis TaxID=3121368 RepID=A0AA95F4K8_9BACL|nr:MAG: hypothetical protein P0Y55_01355 [Cohnella sp.]
MSNLFKTLLSLIVAIGATMLSPLSTNAASIELTTAIKTSFDATVSAADGKTSDKLKPLYTELTTLLAQDLDLESQIKTLHYRSEETLISLRKAISNVGKDKQKKLEQQVTDAKAKYKPLFNNYTLLKKQLATAKAVKNKTLTSVLNVQAEAMKLLVTLAKNEIKQLEANLKKAKSENSAVVKGLRVMLAEIDPIKVQIKSQRSAAGLPRKSQPTVWSNFKYAIKNTEPKSTLDALSTLVTLTQQINTKQKKILELENKINDIIVKTKTELSKTS